MHTTANHLHDNDLHDRDRHREKVEHADGVVRTQIETFSKDFATGRKKIPIRL